MNQPKSNKMTEMKKNEPILKRLFSEKPRKTIVRPFIYLKSSVGSECRQMIVLLAIQIVLLAMSKSFLALIVIAMATVASVISNLVLNKIRDFRIENYYSYSISILQGLIIGMFLPETYPPITVFFVTFCTMTLVRYLFGRFACAFVNPSIFVVALLYIIGTSVFGSPAVTLDLLTARNPSQILIENGFFPVSSFDNFVTELLNKSVFKLFKVSIPEGYVSMIWDTHSVIPAFRFNLATIISSLVIFMFDGVKIIIPFLFMFVYMALVRFLSPVFFNGIPMQGDILLAMLTSGTLFTAVFVINWYGSTPETIFGKIILGIIAGFVAFFICGCGNSPVGMVFTILVLNFISIFIQHYELKKNMLATRHLVDTFLKEESVVNV